MGEMPNSSRKLLIMLYLVWCLPWQLRQWRICLQWRRPGFDPWVRKIPWRREWQSTLVFSLGEFCGHTMGSQRVRHNWATFTHLVKMYVFIVNLGFVYQNDTTILLKHVKVKVAQLCPTLCNSMNCNIVHGILQDRIQERVAFPFSRGSSQPTDWTQVSWTADRLFTGWATREAQEYWNG